MRFIITAQPGPNSPHPDPNATFDEELFSAYMRFNEEMHKAGVLVAAEGLKPGGEVARIEVQEGKTGCRRWPFYRVKGTGRRLLHHRSGLPPGRHRLGAALPGRAGFR